MVESEFPLDQLKLKYVILPLCSFSSRWLTNCSTCNASYTTPLNCRISSQWTSWQFHLKLTSPPAFFFLLGSSGLSRLVSEKNSPSFTLIGVGNMWSLIKSIFSFEIAIISWAHISWPLHQAEFIWKKKQQLVGY